MKHLVISLPEQLARDRDFSRQETLSTIPGNSYFTWRIGDKSRDVRRRSIDGCGDDERVVLVEIAKNGVYSFENIERRQSCNLFISNHVVK